MQLSPGPMTPCTVSVRDLEVRYGARVALHGVCVELRPAELTALIGPNGAGKTTLLRAVAGLLPCGDAVRIGPGRDRPGQAELAYVPQRLGFDPAFPITVGRLVGSGRRRMLGPWRRARPVDRAAVANALERVGLPGSGARLVGELSGGQLQRAVLARALAQEADVLLLDEPLSGVDAPTRSELLDLLGLLCAEGRTVLVSSHDLGLVRRHFARVVALNGTLVADAPAASGLDTTTLEAVFATPDDVLLPAEVPT